MRGIILGLLILYMINSATTRIATPIIAMRARSSQKGILIIENIPKSDSSTP